MSAALQTSRPYSWTQEQDDVLRALWHTASRRDVAKRMGRPEHSVSNRAHVLKLGPSEFLRRQAAERAAARRAEAEERAARESPPVPRKCLCCQRPFDAPGRFIRLCGNCRDKSEGML